MFIMGSSKVENNKWRNGISTSTGIKRYAYILSCYKFRMAYTLDVFYFGGGGCKQPSIPLHPHVNG